MLLVVVALRSVNIVDGNKFKAAVLQCFPGVQLWNTRSAKKTDVDVVPRSASHKRSHPTYSVRLFTTKGWVRGNHAFRRVYDPIYTPAIS